MKLDLINGGNYAILPANIRYDKNLTDSEKLLFCELTALSNKNGYCYAGNKYLSEVFGVTKETISRRLSRLEKKGYIKSKIIRNGKEITARHIYPLMDTSIPIDTNVNTPIDDTVMTPIDANVKENNLSINNLNNNNLNSNRENVLFEKWWKLYPKKTGSKKKILPKFKKAIKEVGEDQFFKATEIYLKTQDEVRFICGPEVFINQERYSKDAMETNKQILQENNRKQMSNYKNNHYEGYDINKQQLQEAEAKRQKDVEEGYMPF